ncbi:MAG: WG repeat-containing protein [Christensenellaceae bacterium]|jgi:hypothetical protein|nr:WG repeat-containing protein [Christensenellaceae bacterium]
MKRACALLLCALALCALPPRAGAAAGSGGPYYVLHPDEDSVEIVDRDGHPPPALTRALQSAVRIAPRGLAGAATRDLGFVLTARPKTVLPGEKAPEEAESAFMMPDGRLLFDFEQGVWYDSPADGFILRFKDGERGWPRGWLVDLSSGEQIDLNERMPGRALNWLQGGEGGWIAAFHEIDASGNAGGSWLCFFGQDFELQAQQACGWAEIGYWEGERVLLYTTEKAKDGSHAMLVEDLGRNTLWKSENADEIWAFFASGEGGEDRLMVNSQAQGMGLVNRQSGEIEWQELAVGQESKPLGGLKTRRAAEGWEVLTEGGEVVVKAAGEYSASYDDSSPILVQGYGPAPGEWVCAVYSRSGEVLRPMGPAPSGGKVLTGYGTVFVPESGRFDVYQPGGGRQSLPLRGAPAGAALASAYLSGWVGGWALQMDFRGAAGEYLESAALLMKPDGSAFLTEDVYQYAFTYNTAFSGATKLCLVSRRRGGQTLQGLIDEEGKTVLPPRYKLLRSEGALYSVRYGGYYGLIDEKGDWVVRRTVLSRLQD